MQIVGGHGHGHGFRFLTSAATQLGNHLLFLAANSLVFVALIVTLVLQGLSLVFALKQSAQCLWMMAVGGGARLLEIFSPWAPPGERERLVAGLAVVNAVLSAMWLGYAYSIPYATVRDYFRSWFYATVLAAQLFTQLSTEQLTSISRRMNRHPDDLALQGRQTFLWTLVLHAGLVLHGSVVLLRAATCDRSLFMLLLLRDPFVLLLRGLFLDRFALTASSGETGGGRRVLYYDLCRFSLHSIIDCWAACAATTPQHQRFLILLFLGDIAAIGALALKVWGAYRSEQRLTDRFPKLSSDDVDGLSVDETCPICLDGHVVGDSVRLPCTHIVHTSCLLQMVRNESMPTSSGRTYYGDFDNPLQGTGLRAGMAGAGVRAGTWPTATNQQRCPVCRFDLNILAGGDGVDSSHAPAAGSASPAVANNVHLASARRRRNHVDPAAPQEQPDLPVAQDPHRLLRSTVGGAFLLDARDFFLQFCTQPQSRAQPQPQSLSHPQLRPQLLPQAQPQPQPQPQLHSRPQQRPQQRPQLQSQRAQSPRLRVVPSTVVNVSNNSRNSSSRSDIIINGSSNNMNRSSSSRTHHDNNTSGIMSSSSSSGSSSNSSSARTARRDDDLNYHEELNYWLPAISQPPAVAGAETEDEEEAETRPRKRKAAVRAADDPHADTTRPKRARSGRVH